MTQERITRFFASLMAEPMDDLDCAAVTDLIARYVEQEAAGAQLQVLGYALPAHLDQCADCSDLYLTLSELARQEERQAQPPVGELWRELREAVAVPAAAVVAAEGAALPAAEVAVAAPPTGRAPAQARPAVAPSWSTRWRDWLSTAMPRGTGYAAASMAVAVLAFGWWQSSSAVKQESDMLTAIGKLDHVTSAKAPDGAWAKVWFSPERSQAVVYAGHLPKLAAGQSIRCWLKSRDGPDQLVAAFDDLGDKSEWWVIEGKEAFERYRALAMTLEPGGQPILEVPLETEP